MKERVRRLLNRPPIAPPGPPPAMLPVDDTEDKAELARAKVRMARKWLAFDAIVRAHQQGDVVMRGRA